MDKAILDLYSDYLVSSFGATTATELSDLLDGEVSHDQITRSLAKKKAGSKEIWQVAKPYVRQTVTKNEHYRQMLKQAVQNQAILRTVFWKEKMRWTKGLFIN
jgi:hypothetical protein